MNYKDTLAFADVDTLLFAIECDEWEEANSVDHGEVDLDILLED
jgi:hypothetical protein